MAEIDTFAVRQERIDKIKAEEKPRVKDSVIEQMIKEHTGQAQAEQDPDFMYFMPLVAIPYDDGTVLTSEQTEELLKYSSFAYKKRILNDVRSGKAVGKIENRRLSIELVEPKK